MLDEGCDRHRECDASSSSWVVLDLLHAAAVRNLVVSDWTLTRSHRTHHLPL